MKKFLALLLATLLLVSMTACGGNKDTNTETNPNTNPSTPSTEESVPDTEDSTSAESKFDWEIRDIERPDDKITLRTVKKTIAEGISTQNTFTDSRLTNYTVESVKEKLSKNEFIRKIKQEHPHFRKSFRFSSGGMNCLFFISYRG